MRILTTAEGFGVFYGPQARVLSAVVMMIYMFMVGVVQVVAVGTITNVMFGWSTQVSMLIGGLVVLAYIVIGGMWAVTYTDIFQFLVMTAGVIILCPSMNTSRWLTMLLLWECRYSIGSSIVIMWDSL